MNEQKADIGYQNLGGLSSTVWYSIKSPPYILNNPHWKYTLDTYFFQNIYSTFGIFVELA